MPVMHLVHAGVDCGPGSHGVFAGSRNAPLLPCMAARRKMSMLAMHVACCMGGGKVSWPWEGFWLLFSLRSKTYNNRGPRMAHQGGGRDVERAAVQRDTLRPFWLEVVARCPAFLSSHPPAPNSLHGVIHELGERHKIPSGSRTCEPPKRVFAVLWRRGT